MAGTVEFAGLEAPPVYRRARRLLEQVGELYPGVRTGSFTEWMGHRPCLPDSLPAIGSPRGHPGLILAFGHGHNGMTSGPVTGRLVADLVAGRAPFLDPAPYAPPLLAAAFGTYLERTGYRERGEEMTLEPLPLILVLLSALMHAGWNLIAKLGSDRLLAMAIMKVPNMALALVLLVTAGLPAAASWPYLLASWGVNCLSFFYLIRAYRGDL